MRRIEKIVTNDGVEHANEREARKHCDEMLGKYLCDMARKLAQIDSYSATIAFLESNLETLHLAYAWQLEGKGAIND